MKSRFNRMLVVGSVGFDNIMTLPGVFGDWIMPDKIHMLNVSFTVDRLERQYGGTGGNCAYNLGLLGMKPYLVGRLGKDGGEYVKHLKQAGVEVGDLKLDKKMLSAAGHVMTDKDDNQIWSYYPGPLVKMREMDLTEVVGEGDVVALLPSEPVAFIKHVSELAVTKVPFMFDPAFFIPNLSVEVLRLGLKEAQITIGNDYEVALMEKKTETKVHDWLTGNKIVVTTLGAKGAVIRQGEKTVKVKAARVKKVADPTGAGDAFRAGFLAGYVQGLDLLTCGQMGTVAAAYTVEKYGTQTHRFTAAEFWARYRENYGE